MLYNLTSACAIAAGSIMVIWLLRSHKIINSQGDGYLAVTRAPTSSSASAIARRKEENFLRLSGRTL